MPEISSVLGRVVATGILVAGVLGLSKPAPAQYARDHLLESFRLVALGAEASTGERDPDKNPNGIMRWESEIVFDLPRNAPADHAAGIELQFDQIRGLTGLRVRRAANGEPANFRFHFLSENELRTLAGAIRAAPPGQRSFRDGLVLDWADNPRVQCIFHVRADYKRHIREASVYFSMDRSDGRAMRECIAEEIAQAMGLLNDDRRVKPSIFNDWANYTELTPHDRILLRLLYHPRLQTGMSSREVMAAAAAALDEMAVSSTARE